MSLMTRIVRSYNALCIAVALMTNCNPCSDILLFPGFSNVFAGDPNSHTGSKTPAEHHEKQFSPDPVVSTQGRWLNTLLGDCRMMILNGIQWFGLEGARFTSFQGVYATVIDYVACTEQLINDIPLFKVLPHDCEWSDHAALVWHMKVECEVSQSLDTAQMSKGQQRRLRQLLKCKQGPPPVVHNHLDDMVTAALEAGKDTDAEALAIFGPVHLSTTTVKVIAYALCHQQGTQSTVVVAGCYWGPGSQLNAVERVHETESVGLFWCTFRKLTDPVPETPLVSADMLAHVFEQWLNPPEVLPPGFDAAQHKMNAMLASYMLSWTVDYTQEGFFSLHFDEEEVTDFKEDLRSRADSAAADDHITYLEIMDIPNDLLMEIFNTCLDKCDAPAEWTHIALVGVLKRGKIGSDPESY
ncbi:uncharacterized protein ARMOST_18144 [Armillaria ostoyae]|uniref:Endonuclease/exonuclease/phosphatase domain-containing protein n=1 Tax=Armillaria ostoyae TaxID=47428 RepID=A0A284S0Z5_ARMOS|nr:uncharacterized protein ARMOST_18144 [Armillaria ostoyae]